MKLHFCWWLSKFSTYKTSERTISSPTVRTNLVLIAVGFVATYTLCWTRSGSELTPQIPQCVQVHNYCSPVTWQQWFYVSLWKMPERHQAICKNTQSQGGTNSSVNQNILCESAQQAKGDTTKHIHKWKQFQRKNTQWLFSQCEWSNLTHFELYVSNYN